MLSHSYTVVMRNL